MKQILQSYLKRLTNLTPKNKSLLLLRLYSGQFIDIHNFDFLLNEPSFNIIAGLIGKKPKVKLCKLTDSRDEDSNLASKKLKRLTRFDKHIYEESGSKDLYVGWPFVKGKFSDGTLVRCPLIYFPVELAMENNTWVLCRRKDVSITFNKAFILAYSYFNKVKIPEDFIEMTLDDLEKDSTVFRTAIYKILKESPLEVNFNQETFIDTLKPFKEYKKAAYEQKKKNGELKLHPEAVLGIFPQAGSYLVPDYQHLIEENKYEDIENFFASRSKDETPDLTAHSLEYYRFLNMVKEEDTFTPFKLDSHQENALKAIKRGHSMVIQGPPGTGKSQLICNIISDFIARQKRVLLVCQKRAALDVVHARLSDHDLAPFTALVHDFKNDRKVIFNQIHQQIENLYEYRINNNSLDAIQLERKFTQYSRKIDQITEEFEDFKEVLFDEKEAGISVKELYLNTDRKMPVINLKQEYRNFHRDNIEEFLNKLKFYFTYHKRFHTEGYTWRDRKRFTGYGIEDLNHMKEILKEIPSFQEDISKRVENLLGAGMDLKTAEKIYEQKEHLKEMLHYLPDDVTYSMFQHIIKQKDPGEDSSADVLWLSTIAKNLLGCFDDPGPEISLETKELGKFQQALREKMRARKNIFANIRWLLFSKNKAWIAKVLAVNNLKRRKKDYLTLEKMIDYRMNLEHNLTRLKSRKWLSDIPEFYLRDVFEKWFSCARNSINAYLIFDHYRNFREYFHTAALNRKAFIEKVSQLYEIVVEIPARLKIWQVYFRDARIDTILSDPRLNEKMISSLDEDFDALCDFDNLKADLSDDERSIINKLLDFQNFEDEKAIVTFFLNSLHMAWIDHMETKYPILRSINSLKFERMQLDLQEAVKEKLKISKDICLLKVREQTYTDVEFNRLNNMITYRDVDHQVTKKKQIWPIRKLLYHFTDEIFDLVPCWMASPEAVSAIFPMQQMFDLVIFDEASQCFAEQGIPAMYRGKQIMITGDPMQLSPFDLYKVRWEEDNDEELNPALEVDSLLDLTSKFLMKSQLRGHYRSQSMDLIDFSNEHFYSGSLTLLPDKNVIDQKKPAIDYIKIEGCWQNNTNEPEADKVIEIIQKLLRQQTHDSLGIVTFNAKQQELILDKIDQLALTGLSIPDDLFIKNIENVQGDERDIIIFSMGYAPNEKGKVQLHFGSLNLQKGENRLNVAITRARKKIIVVTSILPSQLNVAEVTNEGPRLLKKYLEYAHTVAGGNYLPTPRKNNTHNTGWYLKNKIKDIIKEDNLDLTLTEEMPFADLTVMKKNEYAGLVLTDDEIYRQSISIKDLHVYTPFMLSAKNWKFVGVFSREYWHNREIIHDRIIRFLQPKD